MLEPTWETSFEPMSFQGVKLQITPRGRRTLWRVGTRNVRFQDFALRKVRPPGRLLDGRDHQFLLEC